MSHNANQPSFGEALFSGTRQKVLGLLFGQPDRSFTLRELIGQANAGSGAVQREVQRLAASGLLNVEPLGRQKFYSANKNSPIFEELFALVSKTLGAEQRIKSALQQADDDISVALLFGSVAKGTDRADSDIDLLLVSDTLTLEAIFQMLKPVEKTLGRTINATLYTQSEYEARKRSNHPFLRKVLKGQHTLLKGIGDGSTQKSGQDRPAQGRKTRSR